MQVKGIEEFLQAAEIDIPNSNFGKASNRHWFGPNAGENAKGRGHPIMFGFDTAQDFGPFPDGGGYPIHFLNKAYDTLGVTNPDQVLHLCSGSMKRGITVDIRAETNPTIVADARHTPLDDNTFDWIMIDPPYSKEYAKNLYGTEAVYPTNGELLREATRLLKPNGRVGLLHFQVPMFRKPLKLISVYGITTGLGYNIRAWTVLEKQV